MNTEKILSNPIPPNQGFATAKRETALVDLALLDAAGYGLTPAQKKMLEEMKEAENRFPAGSGAPPFLPDVCGFKKLMGTDISGEQMAILKKTLKWGTYGPTGQEPLKWVMLCDCDTSHLENIIVHMASTEPLQKLVILSLLRDRYQSAAFV
jgi:hypothetical protein